ncbi:MAG: DUF4232 domain-containing protein [Bifidobacteriaceae bacterium]|jgi:hypothetical protein|nr:DUF4232 domain-containing protein [Bifidobacteriaceae bacterium]
MMHIFDGKIARVMGVVATSVLLVALGGCGQTSASDGTASKDSSDSSQSSTDSNKDDATANSTDSADSQSAGSDSSDTASSTGDSSNGECTSANLKVSLSSGQGGGAGNAYPYLVFTNSGTSSCTVKGFPGVSLQADGTQIGAAAERDSSVASKSITLKAGDSAHSVLKITNAGAYSESVCSPKKADAMKVYPPDQKQAISVKTSDYTGCGNASTVVLTVRALEAGEK